MESLQLQRCRFRGDRVVPTGDEPLSLEWDKALKLLVPEGDSTAAHNLRRVKTGDFVGIRAKQVYSEQVRVNFIIADRDKRGQVGWLLKKYPNFPDTIDAIFRVEGVQWDSSINEPSKKDTAA